MNPTAYVTNPGYLAPPSRLTYYIDGRGPLRTDTMYATDLSLVWSRKLHGSVEVFFRGLAYNIFNGQHVMAVDTTVYSNASPGTYTAASLPAFNPFTTDAGGDANYRYASKFGTADRAEQTTRIRVRSSSRSASASSRPRLNRLPSSLALRAGSPASPCDCRAGGPGEPGRVRGAP